jgi:hypothetical protein
MEILLKIFKNVINATREILNLKTETQWYMM